MLFFFVPQSTLDEIADDYGASRINNLACERCVLDETVWHVGQALVHTENSIRGMVPIDG